MPLCPHCRHLNPVGNPRCAKCDRWISLDPEPAPSVAAPSEPPPTAETPTDVIPVVVDEWEQSLLELLRANRKIDAIKLVRERFGSSLLDAKNYVEGLPLGAAPAKRDLSEELREVLQKSGKMAAIRWYCERTDKGFADAQQAVDAVAEGRSISFGGGNPDEAILELLRAGRMIEAIRVCRQQSGRGLSDAKQYVEDLGRRHGVTPKASGCGTAALVLFAATVG